MKILLLDGTKDERMSAVPLHLSQNFELRIIDTITPDLKIMCQKYDTWDNIPDKELYQAMDVAIDDITSAIEEFKPDVILGHDYGAAVLSNLVVDSIWSGGCVYLNPEGMFYGPRSSEKLEKFISLKSYWVFRKTDKSSAKKTIEKLPHYKSGVSVFVNDKIGVDSILDCGVLSSIMHAVETRQ